MIRDVGWKGLITTEIPSDSLRELIPSRPTIIYPKNVIQVHSRISQNIRRIMKL